MKDKCDVCGKESEVHVACSAAGAISFAYCDDCATSGREPYFAIVASLCGIDSMKEVADWYKSIVHVTLTAEGKTEEELFEDVAVLESAYNATMEKLML